MNITQINDIHRDLIKRWKIQEIKPSQEDFFELVEQNHAYNFQLWHEEDKARRDDKGFEYVYNAKRAIDGYNQKRNNCMELMDKWMSQHLNPKAPSQCPVHSETPGMMIDRLSILALKYFHMHEQVIRQDVDEDHRNRCQQKLNVIEAQQKQLSHCLELLIQEVTSGTRTFRVYHQFKMYNDATLNPELYTQEN